MSIQENLQVTEVLHLLRTVLEVYNDPEISPELADAFAMSIGDNFNIDVAAFVGQDFNSEGAGYAINEFVITPFSFGCVGSDPFGNLPPGFAILGSTSDEEARRIADSLIANAARKAKGGN